MAGWRDRGYVQDSDEEEDSQNSTSAGPATFTEAVNVDDIGQVESGEQDVEAHGRQDQRGGLQVKNVQDGAFTPNAEEECGSTETLLVQHKENPPLPAVRHDTHNIENLVVDTLEDVDELQQDHYRATPAALNKTDIPKGVHELGARPHLSQVSPDQSSSPSSISSISLPKLSRTDHESPSTAGTQRSTPGNQCNDWESSIHGSLDALDSNLHVNTTKRLEPFVVNLAPVSQRGARNLRHRNPIQLHPYVLESEQYRQTLKARGVKPLRIAQMEAAAAKAREQDSQDIEFDGEENQLWENDTEQPSPYSSSPIHPQGSLNALPQDNEDLFVFGDDDLPDISTILSRSSLRYIGNGYKRRKTAKASSAAFRMPQSLDLDREKSVLANRAGLAVTDDDIIFDVPPSPPRSGSHTPKETNSSALPTFRMPPRLSPDPLPTPIASSEPRRRHLPRTSHDQQFDQRSHRTRQTSETDDSTNPEISPLEEGTSHQFQRAQRKIRGVLPASWLKLDLKVQKKKPADTHQDFPNVSPQRDIAQRGIARMVFAPHRKSPRTANLTHAIEVLSDDEGLESETEEVQQQTRIRHPQHHMLEDSGEEGVFIEKRGEAAEEDQIDAMLPSAPRAFHSRKRSKRQTKIGDYRSHSRFTHHETSKKAFSEGAHQRKIMDQSKKVRKSKLRFRPPKLGILDAPLTKGSPQDFVPQFLKVASRTARSRNNRGRHSPSRKFVRLATREDDNDANETLRNWREGTLVPLVRDPTTEASSRQPLRPRSANSCVPTRASETAGSSKGSELPASRLTFVQSRVHTKRFRKLQTSLDHLIERRDRASHNTAPEETPPSLQPSVEKPNTRGQIVSSLQATKDSRPAMLESAREDAAGTHAQASFNRDLARINHFDDDSGLPGVLVRRFFEDDTMRPVNASTAPADYVVTGQDATEETAIAKQTVPHRRKKRRPRRVSISETWGRELDAPVILDDYPQEPMNSYEAQERDVVVGLGPFGTRYSDTFEITPLPTGTCFSANTLLGSGTFAKALKHVITPNYERSRGYALLKFNDRSLRWGPWNDTVSSELGEVFEFISQSVLYAVRQDLVAPCVQTYEQVLHLQNSTLDYFSDHLSFLDPVDRLSYVLRCKGLLSTLQAELIDHDAVNKRTDHTAANDLPRYIQISNLTLSLANQLLQISKHEVVPPDLQGEVSSIVQKAAHHILDLSLAKGLQPFEICLLKLRGQNADYRIHDHCIEAFIVAQHVLGQDPDTKTSVWPTLVKAVPSRSSDGVFDISLAEQVWTQLFTLLPFFEFDVQGVVETGRRFKLPFENWTLAKRLISPVLEASVSNPQGQPPSFNSYCRAIFGRCLHLINGWGWRRCESIIGTLFDFFARNGLAHLRREESKGSPLFLERLNKSPNLVFEPEDRGFHILLKIIGSGLGHMQQSSPEKRIRDLVWRLMPNHGRSHPKEEAIRQEHLDALRNHHDLLCTLYWASPPNCRPRLTVIRNLVNLETSHREACHISIRAWFNLVKFQLSTDEPINNLEPFAEWYNHLLVQILQQHSLARTEAEEQVRSAQSVGEFNFSKELLERTIARNQRQVEAILGDALVCLELAIKMAQSPKAASTLLSTSVARVFELFDASRAQVNKPIIQALDVLIACASTSSGSRDDNDESQNYGDWSAFDDESSAIPLQKEITSPFIMFQDPLRHLLWNCFGADLVPDDALLLKVVDVWVIVAHLLVQNGLKLWTEYLGHYGNDSWSSLRDTQQTRKFSVYYFASLIERDSGIYHDHKAFFLMHWVCSLVERESLLKFQHRLMSALLNTDSENLLLQNLPFWKDAVTGRYQIAASDLSDRRLSLISSVLSNMRVSLENAILNSSVTSNELRQEFRDLLKHLMTTMKRNYQELGHGSNVRGAYVDFVHRVIEFLQQHTATICPIDRFFTDNSAFPLPATDPTYVIGQLKSYGLRLQDDKTPKQLVVFLQSVSERAAIDGQQPYLAGQLYTAMSNAFEDGGSSTSTLRSFLIKNIMPAYLEMAFSTACGWILAIPYLQALQEVFGELLKDLDGANSASVTAVASTIAAFLGPMRRSLETVIGHNCGSVSKDTRTLRILSACYSIISALLPVLDYIVRLPRPTLSAINTIDFFKSFAEYFSTLLHSDCNVVMPKTNLSDLTVTDTSVSDICNFATQELRDALSKTWVRHDDDQYYVTRGSTTREVVVDIGLYEEQKAQLLIVFQRFFKIHSMMPALREEDDKDILVRREKKLLGSGDLLLF